MQACPPQSGDSGMATIRQMVAAVELLRKSINDIPMTPRNLYQEQLLKDNAPLRNPCRIALGGYTVLVCQFANGAILIRVIDPVALRESGSCETTLAQLGVPSYKKLLKGLVAGGIYRKDGKLRIAVLRRDGEPYGAASLQPMSVEQCALIGVAPKPRS